MAERMLNDLGSMDAPYPFLASYGIVICDGLSHAEPSLCPWLKAITPE